MKNLKEMLSAWLKRVKEQYQAWSERLKRKRLEEESRRAIQVMEWKGSLWISVGGEPLLGAVDTREGLLKTVSKMRETWISRKIKK